MVENVTILYVLVIMKMPYFFLCPIPLNKGKTSRMAFPLFKNNIGPCHWAGAVEEGDKRTVAFSTITSFESYAQ